MLTLKRKQVLLFGYLFDQNVYKMFNVYPRDIMFVVVEFQRLPVIPIFSKNQWP